MGVKDVILCLICYNFLKLLCLLIPVGLKELTGDNKHDHVFLLRHVQFRGCSYLRFMTGAIASEFS